MATETLPSSCRRSITLAAVLIVIGAVLYNNWILSATYNPALPAASAFVSEYSVPSQPNSAIFRATDVTSGALILLGALIVGIHRHLLRVSGCITRYLAAPEGWSIVAWMGTVLFAVSTIADAIFPMTCALSTVNPTEAAASPCAGPLASAHDVTSLLAGMSAISALVATLVLLGRYYGKVWYRSPLMWILGLLALCHIACTSYSFAGAFQPELPFVGYVQRVAIGSLSVWAVLFVLSSTGQTLLRGQHRVASQSLSHLLSHTAGSPSPVPAPPSAPAPTRS